MIEYNYERMRCQNDYENQQVREVKRRVKEELKLAQGKLKHQIKYGCNPGHLLDDAFYFYNPGMTTRQLD